MDVELGKLRRHWREVDELFTEAHIEGEEAWPEWKRAQADQEYARRLQRQYGWSGRELAAFHVLGDRAARAFVEEHLGETEEEIMKQLVEWVWTFFSHTFLTAWSAAEERMAFRGRWVG